MSTFFKVQTASLTASIIDFSLTIICVQILGFWYILGTILGTVCGAVVNFLLGRNWVFNSKVSSIKSQVVKYAMVWTGYLLIVTSGVFLLTHFAGLNYLLSKVVTTGIVGIPYNYFLQKKFIFL